MQLTPKERRRFRDLINQAKQHYHAMGEILKEIRDDKLYLDDYTSFEECLKVEFDMKKTRAYQLIQHVETSTIVDSKTDVFAKNELKESHTRAVATLPDEQKVAVLEAAKRKADEQSLPFAVPIINKTAAEFLQEHKDQQTDDEPDEDEYEDVEEVVDTSFADDSAAIASSARELDRISRELKRLAETPAGACLEWQHVDIALKTVKTQINAAIKWVDCPMCDHDGKKCNECRGIGWLPGRKKNQLSTEAKARLA